MNLYIAQQEAKAAYMQAVREWKASPTQRNADRVKIKQALLDGLKRWILEGRLAA